MKDPDITMEEYIQLEANKARRRGQTFNRETATYGKVRYFKDIDYFKDFETEFPAIVYNDALTSKSETSPEPATEDRSHRGDGQVMFTSHAWRRMFEIHGPLVRELMLKFFSTCRISSDGDFLSMVPSYTSIKDPLRILCHRLIAFSISRRGQAPRKVTATHLFYLRSMDEGTMVNVPYMLAHYLFRLITKESLWGLTVVVRNLTVIDMDELADPATAQAPQEPPVAPAPRSIPQRLQRFKEEVHGLHESVGEHHPVVDAMCRDFLRFTTWAVGRLGQLLDASGVTYPRIDLHLGGSYYSFSCSILSTGKDYKTSKLHHDVPTTLRRTIDQSASGKLLDKNAKEYWALLEDLALYENESWNDPKDFAKPIKAISLPKAPTSMYNAILDKYVESLELGKNGFAFIQGKMPEKMKDLELFTLPCRLGDSKPFDTLVDSGSCVNLIPLYIFKKLKIRLLEETNHVFGLADGTTSYPVGIVKNVEALEG
nr:hypothetical protein [Tanacetum cinerariifolium]